MYCSFRFGCAFKYAVYLHNLNHILNQLNTEYSFDISAKFTITLGDEFQGLLHNCTNLLHITETIQREMYPVKLRFGIGVGEITTDINPELAIGADGPSYYYARKAIHELRNNEKKIKCLLQTFVFQQLILNIP